MDFVWKFIFISGLLTALLFSNCQAQENSNTQGVFKSPLVENQQSNLSTPIRPLLTKDNGKTRFYLENGMFRERTHDSGDNLWRTSLAFIAYEHPALLKGMLSCTEWETKNKVRYYRSFEKDDETVSRDQLTMFLVAMAESGEDVKKYIKATPWRISKKYTLTPDMWLWMKALGGNKLARTFFYLMEIPIAKSYQLWNKRKNPKGRFPSYGIHLLAWQVYSLKNNSNLDHTLKEIVVKMTEEENLLVRLLMCESISQADIDNVITKTDFQWQRDSYSKAIIRPLTDEEAEFNTYDVDILQTMFNKALQGK